MFKKLGIAAAVLAIAKNRRNLGVRPGVRGGCCRQQGGEWSRSSRSMRGQPRAGVRRAWECAAPREGSAAIQRSASTADLAR